MAIDIQTTTPPIEVDPWEGPSQRTLVRLSIFDDAQITVWVGQYEDHEPIRTIVITDGTGAVTELSLGYTTEHQIDLADQFVKAFEQIITESAKDIGRRSVA